MNHRIFLCSTLAVATLLGAGCSEKVTYSAPDANAPATTTSSQTPTPEPPMAQSPYKFPGILPDAEVKQKQIRIHTEKGDIVFELRPDWGANAASNFVYLTKEKFYDNLTFHRVDPGFVIQGGDPLGNGTGNPGYRFSDDVVTNLSIQKVQVDTPMGPQKMDIANYLEGIVAMANSGPNTNGSQFFIMLEDKDLPPSYSVFGKVISGMDVVKKIAIGDKMLTVTIEEKTPVKVEEKKK